MPIVRTFAQMRTKIGSAEINIEGKNVKQLIENLIKIYPNIIPLLLVSTNPLKIYGHWDIIINDQWINDIDNNNENSSFWNFPILENDVIAIVPPIGGG